MPKIATLPLEKKAKKFNNNVYPQSFNGKEPHKFNSLMSLTLPIPSKKAKLR